MNRFHGEVGCVGRGVRIGDEVTINVDVGVEKSGVRVAVLVGVEKSGVYVLVFAVVTVTVGVRVGTLGTQST